MTETGKVIDIKNGRAVVRFERKAACDNCNMCMMRKKDMHIDMAMDNKIGAVKDDSVAVEMKEGGVTLAALLVYGAPLLVMLGAILLAYLLKAPDYIVGIVAVAACLLAYTVLFVATRKLKLKKKIDPEIVRIITKK